VNRGAVLHAKSRNLYPSLAALIALAVGAPLLTRVLTTTWGLGGLVSHDIYLLTALAGVSLISTGLAAADPELEASTPHSTARLRLVHVVVALTAVIGALVGGFALLAPFSSGEAFSWRQPVFIVEAAAVLYGVQALTAIFLRARLSWLLSSLWVILLLGSDDTPDGWRALAVLPKPAVQQPFFAYAAGVALLIGIVAYVTKRVPR
jgi:hypothetical protein